MHPRRTSFGRRPLPRAVAPQTAAGHKPHRELVTIGQLGFLTIALAITFLAYRLPDWRSLSVSNRPATSEVVTTGTTLTKALAGLPNVAIDYYDIDATDAAGILKDLRTKGPRWNGKQFGALTRWNFKWRWDALPGGGCGNAYAQVTFDADVTFPRLARPGALAPDVAQRWQSYVDALARHEANHVRYAYEGHQRVLDAVRSASCSEANAAGHQALAELKRQQKEYDRRTNHGEREGAVFRKSAGGLLSAF